MLTEYLEATAFDLVEELDTAAPNSVVFMPEGTHEIRAHVNGKPATRTVIVDADAAALFQRDLEANKGSKLFLDFEHKRSRHAAVPKSFSYEKGKGVILHLNWTGSGKRAVEDHDLPYVSPSFSLDPSTKKPSGLAKSKAIGGLVGAPAFQEIPEIAAAYAEGSNDDSTTNTNNMKLTELVDAGLLTTAEAESDKVGATIAAKFADLKAKKEAVDAMFIKAKEAAKAAEEALEAAQNEALKSEIQEAIDAKAIEEDEAEYFTAQLREAPEQTRKLIKRLTGKAESKVPETVIAGKAGSSASKKPKFTNLEELDAHLDDLVKEKKYESLSAAMQAHEDDYMDLLEKN